MKRALLLFLLVCTAASAPSLSWAQKANNDPLSAAVSPAPSPTPASPEIQARPGASPSPTAAQLSTIVVTATRIKEPIAEVGTTVTVVESEDIEEQKLNYVSDVLRQVPGLEVTQSGSPGALTSVSVRGATSAQTLILLDGVEVNTGATGQFDLSQLMTGALDRVEVVRGAGGALYGSQAVGGVINLITPEGEGAPKFSLLSEGGNRATQRQAATFCGAQGNLGYCGALSYFSTTGFRPVNDSSDNLTGALRLDYHLDDVTTVRGFARYIRSNVSLVDLSNFEPKSPLNRDAHQRNEFMLYRGEIERALADNLVGRLSAFFVRSDVRSNNPEDPGGFSDIFQAPDETRGANAELTYTWSKALRSLVGFDFKDRWLRSKDDFVMPGVFSSLTSFTARRQEYAGYFEQEASLLEGHILATGGLRVDGNSDFGEEVSPAWSVAIPVTQIDTTFRGSYSEGFRAPSFDELFFPGFGNPALRPEVSSEYDGGFTKSFGERAALTVTYFSRRVHALIVAVPCKFNPVTCPDGAKAGNAGRADVQGLELVPSLVLAPGLRLSGNFTVLDATHTSPAPNIRPLRVPKRSGSGLLEFVRGGLFRPGDELMANLWYSFVGDRDDITPAGTIRSHVGYHLFNAVVSYAPHLDLPTVRNEQIFVRVQNLFERNYAEAFGFRSPPVNFIAGVQLDF